jgi:hypothetical protein
MKAPILPKKIAVAITKIVPFFWMIVVLTIIFHCWWHFTAPSLDSLGEEEETAGLAKNEVAKRN